MERTRRPCRVASQCGVQSVLSFGVASSSPPPTIPPCARPAVRPGLHDGPWGCTASAAASSLRRGTCAAGLRSARPAGPEKACGANGLHGETAASPAHDAEWWRRGQGTGACSADPVVKAAKALWRPQHGRRNGGDSGECCAESKRRGGGEGGTECSRGATGRAPPG